MPFENILLDLSAEGIATLTLNRPAKRNALNRAMLTELDIAFTHVESDPAIKGLILTGSGDKAFVAGADIAELATATAVGTTDIALFGQRVMRRLETSSKPSVAAINGFALGGGLELAMCCTLRIASDSAMLGMPETKLGLIPGYGGSQRLPRLVGRGRALEILLTGEPVDAREALRIGLVNQVTAADDLIGCAK
ncbi:MAG: enoyl-CoA hydratase/isomerase family protein, partial [Bryobacteraceae bacterium]|nr:enoyl-CoA hydratase/isomerase family protein [Bryobacteraceae bacterium]